MKAFLGLSCLVLAIGCGGGDDGRVDGGSHGRELDAEATNTDDDSVEEDQIQMLCFTEYPDLDASTCPPNYDCYRREDGQLCGRRLLTPEDCIAAEGEVLGSPDAGSPPPACPATHADVGDITLWKVPGRCCRSWVSVCAPQEATYEHALPCQQPLAGFYWNGSSCERRAGCYCTGEDCSHGADTLSECQAGYRECATPQ